MSNEHSHEDDHHRDDAPPLPARALLDAWQVPAPAPDLTGRVMAHVDAALPMAPVAALPLASRRKGPGLVVVGVAMLAAAALVLGIAQQWSRPPSAESASVAVAAPPPVDPASPPPSKPAVVPAVEPAVVPAVEPDAAPKAVVPDLDDPFTKGSPAARASEGKAKPKAKPTPDDAATTARLRIGTQNGQRPAEVFIDDVRVGTTPIMNTKVTPGRHTVRWQWEDGTTATVELEIAAGETKTVKSPQATP